MKRTLGIGLGILVGVIGLGTGAGVFGKAQFRQVLHQDVVWYRALGDLPDLTPSEQARFQGSRSWYPLNEVVMRQWEHSPDGIRRRYARQYWQDQGGRAARQWLERQLRRNADTPWDLPFSAYGEGDADRWTAYGLDNPDTAQELLDLALAHLDPHRSPWDQVNVSFVQALAQQGDYGAFVWPQLWEWLQQLPQDKAADWRYVFPYDLETVPAALAATLESWRDLPVPSPSGERDWQHLETLHTAVVEMTSPNPAALTALWQQVGSEARADFLLGMSGSPVLEPGVVALLRQVAQDPQAPEQLLASTLLQIKGDRGAQLLLTQVLDGDWRRLYPFRTYRDGDLLLLQLAEAFPSSRFTQACREYAQIRGGSYFGDFRGWWSAAERPWPPEEEAQRWQEWLARYPDHPGADDATYWLVRSYEWMGDPLKALEVLAAWILNPIGDGDMGWQLRSRLYSLLDVGTTVADLQAFTLRHPDHPLLPLIRYTQALHLARQHQYSAALEMSSDLSLDPLFRDFIEPLLPEWLDHPALDPQLATQRQHWQRLSDLRDPLSLAITWASSDGWRYGYFLPYQHGRASSLSFNPVARADGESEAPERIRAGWQQANHHAIALQLLAPLSQSTQRPIRHQARFWQGVVLYRQWVSYPPLETQVMVPLPGLPPAIGADASLYQPEDPLCDCPEWRAERELQASYVRHLIHIVRELRADGDRRYGDDLLLAVAAMTGEAQWLEQAVQDYPKGDRTAEAAAQLYVLRRSASSP